MCVSINLLMAYFLGITQMVQDAKAVAMNTHNSAAVSRWRESNRAVSIQRFMLTQNLTLPPFGIFIQKG